MKRAAGVAGLALVSLAAVALSLAATHPYPGVTVDSGEYLAVAEGLTEGHGFTMPYVGYDEPYHVLAPGERVPMTQFPPLYPGVLAGLIEAFGVAGLTAGRIVAAVCYFLLVGAAQLTLWRATGRASIGILGGLLLLAPDLVIAHSMVWSEALMIAALIGAVHFTARYLNGGTTVHLVGAGVCGALAALTRFAGAAVIIGVAIAIFFDRRRTTARRIVRSGVVSLLALVPVALWFRRNALLLGTVSEKEPGWHPPGLVHISQALGTVGGWLVPPGRLAILCGLTAVLGAVAFAFARGRGSLRLEPGTLAGACGLFALVYGGFVLAARVLLDQNIPFDSRMLAPLQVTLLIGLTAVAAKAAASRVRALLTVALVVLAVASLVRSAFVVRDFSSLSVAGYTGDQWTDSDTLRYAGTLSSSTVVITNAPDPLWLWHGRAALLLPPRSSLYSGEENTNYSQQLRELLEATRCKEAIVVFFDSPTRKPIRFIDPVIVDELRLEILARFEDGEAYDVDEPRQGC